MKIILPTVRKISIQISNISFFAIPNKTTLNHRMLIACKIFSFFSLPKIYSDTFFKERKFRYRFLQGHLKKLYYKMLHVASEVPLGFFSEVFPQIFFRNSSKESFLQAFHKKTFKDSFRLLFKKSTKKYF